MTRAFDEFLTAPERTHVLQAFRLLEAHFADAPRFGEARRPSEDPIRIGQLPEMAFPTSTIAEFSMPQAGKPGRLSNRFFGLFGPHGPLPLHLTEYARDRLRNHADGTLVGFADMLTHRFATLFYRAWVQGQPAPSFDRGKDAAFERKVAALSGYMGRGLQERDAMPDLAKRHFGGFLGSGPKHAEGLVSIVASFVRAPVRLEQFIGSWLPLEPGDQWQLGRRTALGRSTSIGTRVWSRTSKFRLRIGPLGLAEYRSLLPGGRGLAQVDAIVRNYVGEQFEWELNLVLAARSVPKPILGKGATLGQTTWIGRRPADRDADSLHLNPALLNRSPAKPTATTQKKGRMT
ncbi:type VI secretion system baseplate subunit TssG [Paragemmobacter straminiformis]|nr:type VI secretion system baseplate subunit TssG [Gemmobacter straminiformis]